MGGTANDPSGGLFTGGGRSSNAARSYMKGMPTPSNEELAEMMRDPMYQQMFHERKKAAPPEPPMKQQGQAAPQPARNMRLAELQKSRMANSRPVQTEDDRVFEMGVDSGNKQISLQVIKIRVPFSFVFCPKELATLDITKARSELTVNLQDILKLYTTPDRNNSGSKANDQMAIFDKSWTLNQLALQDLSNSSHLPMCLRVSILRPSPSDNVQRQSTGIEILPQNTVTGIPGEPPCTMIVWPTKTLMERTFSLRPERNKFVRSFLQDRCPNKHVNDVCRVLGTVQLSEGLAYKLKDEDPVCVYIIDNAREDAIREMEASRAPPNNDQEMAIWEQEFNTLYNAKVLEKMEYNNREGVYYVPAKTAEAEKSWIVGNANEVITGRDLFATAGFPNTGGTISIWPFVKLTGAANEKSTAGVFDVNQSKYARVRAVSSDAADVEEVGKETHLFHGVLILSFLKPQGQT